MNISKYHTSFYLQKTYNGAVESQIRMRIRYGGKVFQYNTGYTIDPKQWDGEAKRLTINKDGFTRKEINDRLDALRERVDSFFANVRFQKDRFPTHEELKSMLSCKPIKEKTLKDIFDDFFSDNSSSWSNATYAKFNTIRKHMEGFRDNITVNDFTDDVIAKYRDHLLDIGLQNTVINKEWKNILWFLRWCDKKGLLTNKSCLEYKMNLKELPHQVIYLEWDELMALYRFKFPKHKNYLSRARDFLCFACFTGLRFSDIANLEWSCVMDDMLMVSTIKDHDSLTIPLSELAKSILAKSKGEERPFRKVSSQKLNEYIKDACCAVGITKPIRLSHYKGAERIDVTTPKYMLISSHTGRRTFICNALQMGMSPTTVMLITGHSDFKAMQPYINATDTAKAEAMKSFDKKAQKSKLGRA